MSAQGTILVLDGTSTNRIMLKVQLTAAWYHVVQGERLQGLASLLRRSKPDLVLTSQTLPDGTAADVKKMVLANPELIDVPVVAIALQNDKAAQLKALSDGLDDVLAYPFKDTFLLARVRSLLRTQAETQDLQINIASNPIGFAEPGNASIMPPKAARIAILTQSSRTGALWQNALSKQTHYSLSAHTASNLRSILSGPIPDAILLEVSGCPSGLQLLADLKSRGITRHTVLIGVLENGDAELAAEALDRGIDAVCMAGFCPDEILLRLENQIARKTLRDHMRASLQRGIVESWVDPLTGLHNRRFAMSAIDQMAHQSARKGQSLALMLADIDHFKSVNDTFGHAAGDSVLAEAATRMAQTVGSDGFVARIGGEEFMIGLSNTTQVKALELARNLCDCIRADPFDVPGTPDPISVTISIGLTATQPAGQTQSDQPAQLDSLIQSADTALYAAKTGGRDQVQQNTT